MKKILVFCASLILIAGLVWKFELHKGDQPKKDSLKSIEHVIKKTDIIKMTSLSGVIYPDKTYQLKALYPGYLRSINVEVGSTVKKNQPLAVISESLQTPMDRIFPIRAPFAGTITQIFKRKGEFIDQNEQLNKAVLRLDDLSTLYLITEAPELEVSSIKIGLKAEVTANAMPFQTFGGVVTEVAMSATQSQNSWDAKASTYRVKIKLDPVEFKLKPGMSAIAKIETDRKDNALSIPHQFVGRDDNGYFVRTTDEKKKTIKIGIFNSSVYEVTEGIAVGETVSSIDFSQDFSAE